MTDDPPRKRYEPFPVERGQKTWRSSVRVRLNHSLPRPAYDSLVAGYRGLRKLTGKTPGGGRMLPDFVIIGAAKAGTTSIYAWLCEHPYVVRAGAKEIHYFSWNHDRGADWYRSHFPLERDRMSFAAEHDRPFATGEGSPTYLPSPSAPLRMATLVPDVKLIVVLRDPVDRAYSQFHMRRHDGFEPVDSFATAVALEDERVDGGRARALSAEANDGYAEIGRTYLMRGRYAEQLDRWFQHFPREQFHILTTDQLAADPQHALDGLHDFLGLPAHRRERLEPRFVTEYDPLASEDRELLNEYFREHNERLWDLLGHDFGWGSR